MSVSSISPTDAQAKRGKADQSSKGVYIGWSTQLCTKKIVQ